MPDPSGVAWRYAVLGVLLVAASIYQASAIHAIVRRLIILNRKHELPSGSTIRCRAGSAL